MSGAPTEDGEHPLDPDRLFPTDPAVRAVARELHGLTSELPIISPHGHVPARLLADDAPFDDPAALLISGDHYVTRLLHAHGVLLELLRPGADPRSAWRAFADGWHLLDGTASGYWLREELYGILGLRGDLVAETADQVYDAIASRLAEPGFRPRALVSGFDIEVLATTDDPLDDLVAHRELAASDLSARVLPTFRPDAYLDPDAAGFATAVDRLLAATGEADTFAGYLSALQRRREHFLRHGAVSADHGVMSADTLDLDAGAASSLYERVRRGRAEPADRAAFRAHLLFQMARMSVEDGLVMTVHPGVLRNHSTATLRASGPDTGHDIPTGVEFTRGMRPLLERFGLERDFHLVLFTIDETTFSRELAPLAGFYPSVFIGSPWWFLDAPLAMERFRAAVTETAGFYRGSGFIDDTRALLSIPARHDMARRVDAGFLARLHGEGRLTRASAERIAVDLVTTVPRTAFKL
jgi:glucuronate isomerase